MIALIENNIQAIRDVCKKHHVRSLYLIGSTTRPDHFNDSSDIDLLYRFRKEDIPEMDYADNYFDLLFTLQDMLGRKVDLVAEEKMRNPFFIKSIDRDKQLIYANNNVQAAAFYFRPYTFY
ncbi:nucleotidyltransferase domain-containing protein [Nemorincola caseinilytica]|uniref:Nucleotidyltransferase domain-containing protein n=1 Tax=Nemorincola caseinilytica TaxID=2054315 RepID=A0ABP8N9J3_9BACT